MKGNVVNTEPSISDIVQEMRTSWEARHREFNRIANREMVNSAGISLLCFSLMICGIVELVNRPESPAQTSQESAVFLPHPAG